MVHHVQFWSLIYILLECPASCLVHGRNISVVKFDTKKVV
jgi:hypothetical protein